MRTDVNVHLKRRWLNEARKLTTSEWVTRKWKKAQEEMPCPRPRLLKR